MVPSRLVFALLLATASVIVAPNPSRSSTPAAAPLCPPVQPVSQRSTGIPAPIQNGPQHLPTAASGPTISLADLGLVPESGEWRCWAKTAANTRFTQMVVRTRTIDSQSLISGGFFLQTNLPSEKETTTAAQLFKTLVARYSKAPAHSIGAIDGFIDRFLAQVQTGKIAPSSTFYPVDETGIFIMYAPGSLQISITMQ